MTSYTINNIRYLEPQSLRHWFTTGKSPTGNGVFTIVDVRDYDHIGGHIKNSIHFPSNKFNENIDKLLKSLSSSNDIVFHCALSQQRGPSSAMKFLRSVPNDEYLNNKNIWILKGGFANWQSLYGEDPNVTENFQKDLWR